MGMYKEFMAMLLEKVLVIMDKLMVVIVIEKVLVVFGKVVEVVVVRNVPVMVLLSNPFFSEGGTFLSRFMLSGRLPKQFKSDFYYSLFLALLSGVSSPIINHFTINWYCSFSSIYFLVHG